MSMTTRAGPAPAAGYRRHLGCKADDWPRIAHPASAGVSRHAPGGQAALAAIAPSRGVETDARQVVRGVAGHPGNRSHAFFFEHQRGLRPNDRWTADSAASPAAQADGEQTTEPGRWPSLLRTQRTRLKTSKGLIHTRFWISRQKRKPILYHERVLR